MSQINPEMLMALTQAANTQANVQPVADEQGQPVMDARRGNPKDVSDFLTRGQSATHHNQVRSQGPVSQALGPNGAGGNDPTADLQRDAMGTYNIPTSANQSRQAMQVPQHLLDNDQFRGEMDHARSASERQNIVDRYTANSQTDVDKQDAAYDKQQAGVQAQHTWAEPGAATGMDVVRGTGAEQTSQHFGLGQETGGPVTQGPPQQPGQPGQLQGPYGSYIQAAVKDPAMQQAINNFANQSGVKPKDVTDMIDHHNSVGMKADEAKAGAIKDVYNTMSKEIDSAQAQVDKYSSGDHADPVAKKAAQDRLDDLNHRYVSVRNAYHRSAGLSTSISGDKQAMWRYSFLANGDPAKAWELAKADGWTQ